MSKFIFAHKQDPDEVALPSVSPPAPDQGDRLSDVPRDQAVEIVGLDARCEGFGRRRLMDLGFTRGTTVLPALDTFAGDPRGYLIRGTLIALRREQAALILVRPRDQRSEPTTGPEERR